MPLLQHQSLSRKGATGIACGVLLVSAHSLSDLAYSPEAGATDSQYWEVSHTLEVQEVEASLSDDSDVQVPELEMRTSRTRALTLDQVHEASAKGAPTSLRRTFVEVEEGLTGTFQIPSDGLDELVDAAIDSPLEDLGVRLAWDPSKAEWTRTFVDEDGEEADGEADLLVGLQADAHLGGILTALGDVKVGERFDAGPRTLLALVVPGGDLGAPIECSPAGDRGMEPIMAGLDPLLGMDLYDILAGEAEGGLEGEIGCRVLEVTEGKSAKIELTVDVTATRDVADRVAPWTDSMPEGTSATVVKADATMGFTGEGTLLWNLESGLPAKLELNLELSYGLEREAEIEIPGSEVLVLSTSFQFGGELTSKMTAE